MNNSISITSFILLGVSLTLLTPCSCFHSSYKPILFTQTNDRPAKKLQMTAEKKNPFNDQNDHEPTSQNRRSIFLSTTSLLTNALLIQTNPAMAEEESASTKAPTASFALRRAGSLPPSLTNLPPSKLGIFVRFGESLLFSDDATRTPGKDIYASLEYPADWLQLDRILGGVQFVDQRNGDKLYIFKVKLPEGVDKLDDVPKSYIGDAIFNPKGDLVRTGNNVEDYKVLSAKMITDEAGDNIPRRRFKVRYTTLTGNNFSVERKGLIDAYEVGGMIYMLMTGSNSVLFEKKGREFETVNYIADSFRVTPV